MYEQNDCIIRDFVRDDNKHQNKHQQNRHLTKFLLDFDETCMLVGTVPC